MYINSNNMLNYCACSITVVVWWQMTVGWLHVLARFRLGKRLASIGVTSELRPTDVTTAVFAHLRLMDGLRATSAHYLVP
jgi:hypothetical protein